MDSSTRKDAAKVHSVLLPVAAKAANDPGLDVREANMGVLVAFAVKAGNMGLLDKVNETSEDSCVPRVALRVTDHNEPRRLECSSVLGIKLGWEADHDPKGGMWMAEAG